MRHPYRSNMHFVRSPTPCAYDTPDRVTVNAWMPTLFFIFYFINLIIFDMFRAAGGKIGSRHRTIKFLPPPSAQPKFSECSYITQKILRGSYAPQKNLS